MGNAFAELTKNSLETIENTLTGRQMAEDRDDSQENPDPTQRRLDKAREEGFIIKGNLCIYFIICRNTNFLYD